MSKLRAFSIHLIASVIIFLVFLGIMFWVWYPPPYFAIDGGWVVLRVLASVDVVVGPLLTLILFKPGKPGLKFDMSCIILMQLGALIYGGTTIYQQRPAFVVFSVDRFTTVPAAEVEFDKLKYPELQRHFGIGPLFAQAPLPDDFQQQQDLLFGVLLEGQKDLEFRAEFYKPYQPDLAQLRTRSIDLKKIAVLNENAKIAIEAFVAQHEGRLEGYFYLPLRGKHKDIVMVLSSKDGMPVGSIDISPWLGDY
ncbi:MAG: hypothetical protein H6975_10775 [Gammaproteobacteria bacterium]|nr:hypothetical protein [Gammaproteobacteria bacterium]